MSSLDLVPSFRWLGRRIPAIPRLGRRVPDVPGLGCDILAISGLGRDIPAVSDFCGHNLAIFCQHDVLEEMEILRSPWLITFSRELEDGIRSEEGFDFGVLGTLMVEKVEIIEDVGQIEEVGDWKEL